MPKQRLEGFFSKSLKFHGYWYLKLQSNLLSHKNMPADYIILPSNNHHRYLVECKETQGRRFSFNRLTQFTDLELFQSDSKEYNYSYLLLMFWKGRLKTSEIFLINIDSLIEIMKKHKYKSLSAEECNEYYKKNYYNFRKIEVNNLNLLNLNGVF